MVRLFQQLRLGSVSFTKPYIEDAANEHRAIGWARTLAGSQLQLVTHADVSGLDAVELASDKVDSHMANVKRIAQSLVNLTDLRLENVTDDFLVFFGWLPRLEYLSQLTIHMHAASTNLQLLREAFARMSSLQVLRLQFCEQETAECIPPSVTDVTCEHPDVDSLAALSELPALTRLCVDEDTDCTLWEISDEMDGLLDDATAFPKLKHLLLETGDYYPNNPSCKAIERACSKRGIELDINGHERYEEDES